MDDLRKKAKKNLGFLFDYLGGDFNEEVNRYKNTSEPHEEEPLPQLLKICRF